MKFSKNRLRKCLFMKMALSETKYIFDKLLSEEQKYKIQAFLNDVKLKKEKYSPEMLWVMDQSIGGMGGYCMPPDPKINPFPGGINRELFRTLQYARMEIDICDVRVHARQVVHYSGMHLEAVLRIFLKETKTLGSLRFFNSTLGKASHEIAKTKIFDKILIEALFKFVALYNKAKHEVNMSIERPKLFTEADAIVCYFCARIIGQVVLLKLNYSLSLNTYEINNEAYGF
jgi:hypothetical protein